MKNRKNIFLSGIIFLLLPIFIVSCGKETEQLKNGTVTFAIGNIKIDNNETRVGKKVYSNNIIETGKNSIVTIQFSKVAILTIKSDTTIKIEKLTTENGKEIIDLSQKNGSTFNRVVKKGIHYSIKTPTMVAGIRGTSFDITLFKNKSTVRLLKGKIKLTRIKKDGKEEKSSTILTEGHSITSNEKEISKPLKISSEEREELEQFNKIDLISIEKIKKIEKAPLGKESLIPEIMPEKIKKQILEIKKEKTTKKPVKRLTLKELKKKYGDLLIVETKNNRKYIGSFKQNGNKVEVITTKGKVKIKSDNIKKISRYKF